MSENLYHYPCEIYFHGGIRFDEARELVDNTSKIRHLKKRLEGYYLNGFSRIKNPFTIALMVCIGVEVIGQVFLGTNEEGETIPDNTLNIYKMLDDKLCEVISPAFAASYAVRRAAPGQPPGTYSGMTYAGVLRKGLRNTFSHSYRSLGVFLDDHQDKMIVVNETDGLISINARLFRSSFKIIFRETFQEAMDESNTTYRDNAIQYFERLIG